jgi:glutathione S-transferase
MLRLYDYLPSQNGYKIRLLLALLGLEYDQRIVEIFQGESRTAAFLEMNPGGAVPVLETAPGEYLAESNAILFYLAQGTAFLPSEPLSIARVVQWFCFEQNQLESSVGSLRYWTLTGKIERRNKDTVALLRNKGEQALRALERGLTGGDFLVGNRYSVADIAVFAYAHLAEEGGFELPAFPAVQAWIARIKNHPGHLDEMFSYDIDPHSMGEL